jgi:hypothetical protein
MPSTNEIDLILQINGTQAKAAIEDLRKMANDAGKEAVAGQFRRYADNIGDLAAKTLSKAFSQTNTELQGKLVQTVNKSASAMRQAIADMLDEKATPSRRADAFESYREQVSALEALDERDVAKVLTRGWTDSLRDPRTGRAMATTFSDTFKKSLQGIDLSDFLDIGESLGSGASDIFKGMAEKRKMEQTAALAAGETGEAAALGRAAAAMGTAAAAITAIVGVLTLLAMWTKAADDAQKKLNNSILEGAGASDFVSRSYNKQTGNAVRLSSALYDMRNAAYEVASQFRFADVEDATRILAELNQAGVTYKEIAGSIESATGRQLAFEDALTKTITRSRMLGLSTQEVAQYQNTLMTELGYSLDTMGDVFGSISNAAETAGMSTKTFFTAVSQATSGMALYAVRISEAIGFLTGFSDALSEQDVAQFVQDLSKGPQGAQEAIRDVVVASKGGDPTVLVGAFHDATAELIEDFGRKFSGQEIAIRDAFTSVGFSADTADIIIRGSEEQRKELATMINAMPNEQRRQLQTVLGDEMGREFQKISQLSQGITPTVEAQSAAYLGAGTPALRMEMLHMMTDYFGGTDAARSDARARAAFETTTGKSGEDLTRLFNAIDMAKGQLEIIERIRKGEDVSAAERAALEEKGFAISGTSVTRGTGDQMRQIDDIGDIYQTMDEATELTSKGQTEQEKQAQMMYDVTHSIFNVLDTEIKQALFETNTILDDMFSSDSSGAAQASRERRAAAKASRQRLAASSSTAAALEPQVAELEAKLKTGTYASSEAREADQTRLTDLRTQLAAAKGETYREAGADLGTSAVENTGWFSQSVFDADPQSVRTALDKYTGLGTAESQQLDELLEQYENQWTDREANPKAGLSTLDMLKGGGPTEPMVQTAQQIKNLVNQLGQQAEHPFTISPPVPNQSQWVVNPIQDAFFSGGKVYRPHDRDRALFFQDGGPMDPFGRGGGGRGNVVININGGDQALVYRTVARALRASQG